MLKYPTNRFLYISRVPFPHGNANTRALWFDVVRIKKLLGLRCYVHYSRAAINRRLERALPSMADHYIGHMQYEGYLRREETKAAILKLAKDGVPIKQIARQLSRQCNRDNGFHSVPRGGAGECATPNWMLLVRSSASGGAIYRRLS